MFFSNFQVSQVQCERMKLIMFFANSTKSWIPATNNTFFDNSNQSCILIANNIFFDNSSQFCIPVAKAGIYDNMLVLYLTTRIVVGVSAIQYFTCKITIYFRENTFNFWVIRYHYSVILIGVIFTILKVDAVHKGHVGQELQLATSVCLINRHFLFFFIP